VSQAADIARYTVRLADRIGSIVAGGEFPLILGGDCSIGLGAALAMRRLGEDRGGRIGLVYVDAHSDFRHPGNAKVVGAAAGEALALITGRGQADLAAIEQRRPYIRDRTWCWSGCAAPTSTGWTCTDHQHQCAARAGHAHPTARRDAPTGLAVAVEVPRLLRFTSTWTYAGPVGHAAAVDWPMGRHEEPPAPHLAREPSARLQ
jgi:hypothetical protein